MDTRNIIYCLLFDLDQFISVSGGLLKQLSQSLVTIIGNRLLYSPRCRLYNSRAFNDYTRSFIYPIP